MMVRSLAILLAVCLGADALRGQATPSPALLALSKADMTLAIVDPATLKVVSRVPAGPDPHEVVASADGRFAYISNYGGGAYNTITVVDLLTRKALQTFDLGALRGPHGLDYAGGKVWFTSEVAKVIGSYDPATNKIDLVLGTGQNRTHMIVVSEDLKRIVTSNVNSATVTVIERVAGGSRGPGGAPQSDWDETIVAVGRGAEGLDVSPDGKELWVANAQDGTVSIIDAATRKVTQTLAANVNGANRLKFTPDGRLVFISSLRSSDIAIFDAASRREVKRVKVGRGAAGIQMQPDGLRAYVACSPDDYIAVVDVKSLEVVGRIEAGRQPDGLAWTARK
ncbi:MAG TPA: cytochrome D1 domain-containing protein [Gemmatimonadaceae bacterium]|nr:cytochrome D1 domain-containing protein [Gemmatimonadaceae bacterium]